MTDITEVKQAQADQTKASQDLITLTNTVVAKLEQMSGDGGATSAELDEVIADMRANTAALEAALVADSPAPPPAPDVAG